MKNLSKIAMTTFYILFSFIFFRTKWIIMPTNFNSGLLDFFMFNNDASVNDKLIPRSSIHW